jgi:hypothetical protein
MAPPDLQTANLDLLMQLDRLLTEADRARVLRDQLIALARERSHRPARKDGRRQRQSSAAIAGEVAQ